MLWYLWCAKVGWGKTYDIILEGDRRTKKKRNKKRAISAPAETKAFGATRAHRSKETKKGSEDRNDEGLRWVSLLDPFWQDVGVSENRVYQYNHLVGKLRISHH